MSLNKALKDIAAPQARANLGPAEPPLGALERWNPALQASVAEDDRTISIYDVIGEGVFSEGFTLKRLRSALRGIGARDLVVNINSPGGAFFEGVAIYNELRAHPARVTVRVMGMAASAASLIAMAGDDIEIAQAGFMMIHNTHAVAIGDRNAFLEAAAWMEPFDRSMRDVYAARSGQLADDVAQMMDRETYFDAATALENGFATALLAADRVGKSESADTQARSALARIDRALARDGVTVADRRRLYADWKSGTPRAADTFATPRAGDDIAAALRGLTQTLKG